jgi:hypothetical protein
VVNVCIRPRLNDKEVALLATRSGFAIQTLLSDQCRMMLPVLGALEDR